MFVKSCWHLMLFAALVAATGPVCAQGTEAGRFLSVVGDVRVGLEGAPQRAAQRAAGFYEGESIITGAGALAQLRMTDGALMSVRGDTEIKLEKFSYAGEQDRNASFFMSVLKGGLRTITGVIGRHNRERYRITTATVTIGVRGTDFEIVHVPPQAASQEVPAGTYDYVFEGVTSMQNRAGVLLLVSRDQTAFAALQGTTPPVLVAPPAALFGRRTPIPQVTPQTLRQDDDKADKPQAVAPATRSTLMLTPIDPPGTLETSRSSPTIQTAPTATSTPIQTAPLTDRRQRDVTGADKVMLTPVVDPANPTTTTTLTQVVTGATLAPTTVLRVITNTQQGTSTLLLKAPKPPK
jgi:hypothetical protein